MNKAWGPFFLIVLSALTTAQTVEFRVDMGVQAYKGLFNPATDIVKIAGNFNGWNNGSDVLTDLDGDTIYTITKTFSTNETLIFKFIKGSDGWEQDPNREYTVPSGITEYADYFNRDYTYRLSSSVQITFACDMYYEITSGRFKPDLDTLSLRGSFNGWSDQWVMSPTAEPTIYAISKTFITYAGEVFNYKFVYQTSSDTIWEGDPNKNYTVTDSDVSTSAALIIRVFNDAWGPAFHPASKINFTVSMSEAVSSINLQPFSSVTDVRICGDKIPLRWPSNGWPDTDSIFAIKLFDDGSNGDLIAGDNIWSVDLHIPFNAYNRVKYKYNANWGLPTNNGGNENESSSDTYHYFDIPSNILRATVVNAFGIMGEHQLNDQVILDVEGESQNLVSSYNLEQNYPNPFNPSTKIRFSIPLNVKGEMSNVESRHVSKVQLKVYDILGNEAASLVDEFKSAGSYEVEFNAKAGTRNLASGIYFYQLKVNDPSKSSGQRFIQTKKMIFLK